MKLFGILLILSFSILTFRPKYGGNRRFVFLLYQSKSLRPIGFSEKDFWSYKDDFDTITITSNRLVKRIENKIGLLSPIEVVDIDYNVAIVRFRNESAEDTIYTDRFFHEWQIHGRCFEDKSRFFEKLFVNFFEGQIDE